MSNAAPFIAGDWGTSNLRLSLCQNTTVLDSVSGPGVAASAGRLPDVLFEAISPWVRDHGKLPVLLCGMVGSSIGWVEAAYHPCPADVSALAAGLTRFDANDHMIAIVPGLACINPQGAPDVMRGEETQILGALARHPDLGRGRRLLCLPGTHAKWAWLVDGRVERFQTAMTGELFAILRQHSVLGRGTDGMVPGLGPAFDLGLERARSGAGLTHLLFEARSRQLRDAMPPANALSFLSALVIGSDVSGAVAANGASFDGPVTIIAAPALADSYARALHMAGIDSLCLDGSDLSLAGLSAIHSVSSR